MWCASPLFRRVMCAMRRMRNYSPGAIRDITLQKSLHLYIYMYYKGFRFVREHRTSSQKEVGKSQSVVISWVFRFFSCVTPQSLAATEIVAVLPWLEFVLWSSRERERARYRVKRREHVLYPLCHMVMMFCCCWFSAIAGSCSSKESSPTEERKRYVHT